ncbi:MAG: efflux RND transporter periplasmic adaptor subunit [Cellulophaga sp.]
MKNNKYTLLIIGLIGGALIGFFISQIGGYHSDSAVHSHEESSKKGEKWTCSMHPQIMQSEPGSCPICGMDLTPVTSGADGLAKDQIRMTESAMALANIQISIVEKSKMVSTNSIKLSGKIKVNKDKIAAQSAHFNGRIEQLFINTPGEKVRIGQAVATIYSPDLISAQQELLITAKTKETQPDLYNAVKEKFKNWNISDSELVKIERSGVPSKKITIYATISGVVNEIIVSQGDHIMNGGILFSTTNLNTVWASFDAYENQISLLKLGQKISITTNAYPNKVFNAKIVFINPILNSANRTIEVRAVLNNANQILKPGMFIEGKLTGSNNKLDTAIFIPESAVLWTGERSLVYLKVHQEEPIFALQEITLGNLTNGQYAVTSGLENGDEIVTNGTFTVDAAAQLQGKKSMMNK